MITLRLISCCRKSVFGLVLLTAIAFAAKPSISDDFSERRITAGAKIFRALLAADVDIDRKTNRSGALRLCLLYVDDTSNAEKAAATLVRRDDPRIRNLKISIEMLPFQKCSEENGDRIAGIFLTQSLSTDKLQTLMTYASQHHMILFSPFEGDVERGVQGGIAVEARVRPYLNIKALGAARVQLKSFFLKVAKAYEE